MDEALAVKWVSGVIRSEMKRRGFHYVNLLDRLDAIGVKENERNLRNKIARGTFSAVFFVQCLEAMGVKELKIDMASFVKDASTKPGHNDDPNALDGTEEMPSADLKKILADIRALLDEDK